MAHRTLASMRIEPPPYVRPTPGGDQDAAQLGGVRAAGRASNVRPETISTRGTPEGCSPRVSDRPRGCDRSLQVVDLPVSSRGGRVRSTPVSRRAGRGNAGVDRQVVLTDLKVLGMSDRSSSCGETSTARSCCAGPYRSPSPARPRARSVRAATGQPKQTGRRSCSARRRRRWRSRRTSWLVLSSVWTSSPTTISQSSRNVTVDRRRSRDRAPAKSCASLRPGPSSCTRSAVPPRRCRRESRSPAHREVARNREDVREVHRHRVGGLRTELEGHRRWSPRAARRPLGRRGESVDRERADLQRLSVVGVVVAGRERVGAEHDAALHFVAEAAVRVASIIAVTSSRPREVRNERRRSARGCSTPRPGDEVVRAQTQSELGTESSTMVAPALQDLHRALDRGDHLLVSTVNQFANDADALAGDTVFDVRDQRGTARAARSNRVGRAPITSRPWRRPSPSW